MFFANGCSSEDAALLDFLEIANVAVEVSLCILPIAELREDLGERLGILAVQQTWRRQCSSESGLEALSTRYSPEMLADIGHSRVLSRLLAELVKPCQYGTCLRMRDSRESGMCRLHRFGTWM